MKKQKQWFQCFVLFLISIGLISCSKTSIKSLDVFDEVSIPAADVLPSKEELKGIKPKVVVFDLENMDSTAKDSNLGKVVASKIIEVITQSNAEVIDRSTSDQFAEEVRLSQQNEQEYSGPLVAQYAIGGSINRADFAVEYEPQRKVKSIIDGKTRIVEAYCRYSASVAGEFKLFKLPENKLIKQYRFDDSEYYNTSPTPSSSTVDLLISSIFKQKIPGNCSVDSNIVKRLVNQASEEAIRKNRIDIQNFFSPRGYITNMYNAGNTYLAKVSIGSSSGLKQDQKVNIYTIIFSKNALTGENSEEKRKIATGLVTNQIQTESAYLVLETEEAEKIRLGDFVKIEFEKSGFESFGDFDWLK